MSLSSALGAALSGLRTSQEGLDLVAANVANAQTPGYVKKTLVTSQSVAGGRTVGVKVEDIRRELDAYLQRQLRSESAGAAYASTRAAYLDRVQTIFGTPGGASSLDTVASNFSTALDAFATTPDDQGARADVLSSAQIFAQTLNAASRDIQNMREEADSGMRNGVDRANQALRSIDQLTDEIVRASNRGESTAALMDQRDVAINELASLMDIKVEELAGGDIKIKTQSGLTLFDGEPSTLSFEEAGVIGPQQSYSADATQSSLGTIRLTRPSGYSVDLLAGQQLRSGELRALADLRDKTLPQAQTQLDELAANLAEALGKNTIEGTAIADGVDLSTAGALAGDKLTVSYTQGGVTRSVTIVNVGDPSALPLKDDLTADPNDTVIGIDFSSPTAAADLDAALAGKGIAIDAAASASGFALTSSNPALTITGGKSKITATALSGDGLALPIFVDASGGGPYSGSLDGGDQRLGFAGRIKLNPALLDDPSALTVYASGTSTSDPTRANFLRDAISADISFRADTGVGGTSAPFKGSLRDFASALIDNQARASASAARVSDGQSLIVSSLSDRFSSTAGVDVDEEMGRLIQLQTAYGANARVISVVKEMMDTLMQI